MKTTETDLSVLEKDRQCVWHPFTPVLGRDEPLEITKAQGVYLHTACGRKIIDAISSWWVNLHGHSHPYIAKAIAKQATELEHVIFADFTHRPAVELAEKLLSILPENQHKVFYSDNGSTSVEVGIKMALQFWYNQGIQKNRIIAVDGAYHGDTFGSMAVGGRGPFTGAFDSLLFDVDFIDFPKKNEEEKMIKQFTRFAEQENVAAFIFEPLVQGAAGMRMYSPEILDQLIAIAHKNNVICIADEVMTGFGRTGKLFASDYLTNKPDIMCLSKGITGGFLPLGATTCTEEVFRPFLSGDLMKTFFHGHSYTANPIACAAALASFDLLTHENCAGNIARIEQNHYHFTEKIKENKNVLDVRVLGTILAVEVRTDEDSSYINEAAPNLYRFFLEKNVLLRPLGNVVYILPPYVITNEELKIVYDVIEDFLTNITS